MSHSTHVGFSCPGTTVGKSAWLPRCILAAAAAAVRGVSEAHGVGNLSRATAVARSSPPLPSRFIRAKSGPLGEDLGVGHIPRAFAAARLLHPPSRPVVLGVGHNENSVT